MTPKRRVLKRYPKAFAETCGQQGWQIVTPRPYGTVLVLSRFGRRNRRAAWADAASTLAFESAVSVQFGDVERQS